ncbi:hypothetical protein ISCGN_019080 [Ixodes scapularis]
MAANTRAAKVTREEASEDTVGINAQQNIIVVSTPDEQRATRYARMTTIEEGGKTYEVSAYRTAPDGTVKGVVRGINIEETAEDITLNIVNKYNPTAVEAHRIGDSTAVIVLFAGNKVPHYIKYGIVLMKCGLYRKHFDVCRACGKLGHRRDVCPNPGNRFCFGCGKADPEEGHEIACQPKCKLCGGPHPTGEWNCKNKYKQPYVVKCRQWEKKTDASERRITAGDFPLLGPRAIERTNSTSRRRADSQRRVDSMERRGRSISRRREASRPRGETSWADTIRTPKLGGRQSNADSQHDKNRQEDSAAIKALRDENEKLRKKILEQDNIIKEINEKLAVLVRNKEEQASPAQAAKTNEIMIEEDSEIEAIKNLSDDALKHITKYFNKCWREGTLPKQWKTAKTILIPKPGKPPSVENLRPISLTSCVGKLLEHVLLSRWQQYLEDSGLYPDSIIGFRKKLGTQDAMIQLKHEIVYVPLSTGDNKAILGLDLQSAFDKVEHSAILAQLSGVTYWGDAEDEDSVAGHLAFMAKEVRKGNPDWQKIALSMERTFDERRHWMLSAQPLVADIPAKYPALEYPQAIRQEFHLLTKHHLDPELEVAIKKYGKRVVTLAERKWRLKASVEELRKRLDVLPEVEKDGKLLSSFYLLFSLAAVLEACSKHTCC